MLVIGAVVLVLALVIGYAVTRSSNKPQAGSDIPLDILAMNASQLSNNNYVLDGTVIDRFSPRRVGIDFLFVQGCVRTGIHYSHLRFRRSQKWNEHQQRPAIQNRIPGGGYQPERARRVYGYLHPA